ncbi:hypothetical protein BsWGS_15915 [Bradybaena similaris]
MLLSLHIFTLTLGGDKQS